jgi:hypothetical protein
MIQKAPGAPTGLYFNPLNTERRRRLPAWPPETVRPSPKEIMQAVSK